MRVLKLFSFALLAVLVSLMSTGVTHATIAVDGPYIDTTTQGDWPKTYGANNYQDGACFFLIPWGKVLGHEDPLERTSNICQGGSFLQGTPPRLTWDMFINNPADPRPLIWQFGILDYVMDGPYGPTNDWSTSDAGQQWNPCLDASSGATFDNHGSALGWDPLASVLNVNHTGSLRIAYYFLEELIVCRDLEYKLYVNDIPQKTGNISNFDGGKYVVFIINGLTGATKIQLDVYNPYANPFPTNLAPGCSQTAGKIPGVNVHFSGIFIDQCCNGTIGNFTWNDANKDGFQAGEQALGGAIVSLFQSDGTTPVPGQPAITTGANGAYSFTGLCPGTYVVKAMPPAGYAATPVCFNTQNVDGDANCSPQTVVSNNDTNNTIDFGFYKMMMCPGTGTPGYWKNHPEAWPVESITVGGVTYTKAKAIALMECSTSGNKLFTMFPALVAAKLNALRGCGGSCIDGTIMKADAWMAKYAPNGMPLTCGGKPIVYADSKAWKVGEPLYWTLDKYNNGQLYVNGALCAPHRN